MSSETTPVITTAMITRLGRNWMRKFRSSSGFEITTSFRSFTSPLPSSVANRPVRVNR